ncbi:MAG: TrkH family potassium uptake protein, partial [Bacteroidales bacterium]|nr:TrkH family potassium uptake protein [Bacteroidales bacterium]
MLNHRTIVRILGLILITEGFFMWLTLPVSLIFGEKDFVQFLLSGAITIIVGLAAYLPVRKTDLEVNRRDGYVIVTGAWILFSLFGTLPFLLTRSIPGFT